MNDARLSHLTPQRQGEIVRQRLAETKLLHELNRESGYRDPIIAPAADLDLLAKSMGCYIEYNEDLEDDEIE